MMVEALRSLCLVDEHQPVMDFLAYWIRIWGLRHLLKNVLLAVLQWYEQWVAFEVL
jgi:hypothetical protein